MWAKFAIRGFYNVTEGMWEHQHAASFLGKSISVKRQNNIWHDGKIELNVGCAGIQKRNPTTQCLDTETITHMIYQVPRYLATSRCGFEGRGRLQGT